MRKVQTTEKSLFKQKLVSSFKDFFSRLVMRVFWYVCKIYL